MSEHVLTDTFFENFDLHPGLQQGLADSGFTRCTPIQQLTLPVALAGRDLAGQAQTGTGKTCAFLVAMMNHLLTQSARAERADADPRALVIAPTRELAMQIDKDARALGAATGLRIALVYGGVDYDKQRQLLADGCDIIIATPGRLLDYYKQKVFRLDNVETMVIDEADRMFDLGFIKDVRYIFRRLPPRDERQVMLYSATLSLRVQELAYEHMNEPEKLVAETETVTADKVRQRVYFPSKEDKSALLLNLLGREKPERSLVFVNTRAQTDKVRDRLRKQGYRVAALSGSVPQSKRQKILERFKEDRLEVLVCTDVAARGLHIPHVSHVFNFDLPQDAEDYVHRIGRTGRLGEEGDAVSFACDLYAMSLPDIETFIEQKIPVAETEADLLVMPEPIREPQQESSGDAKRTEGGQQQRQNRGQGQGRRRSRGGSRRGNTGGGQKQPSGQAGAAASGQQSNGSEAATRAADDDKSAAPGNAAPEEPGSQQASNPGKQAGQGSSGDRGGSGQGNRRRRGRRGGRNRNRNRSSQGAATSGNGQSNTSGVDAQTTQASSAGASNQSAGQRSNSGRGNGDGRGASGSSRGGNRQRNQNRQGDAAAASNGGQAQTQRADNRAPAPSPSPSPAADATARGNGNSTHVQAKSAGGARKGGFLKRLARNFFGGDQ